MANTYMVSPRMQEDFISWADTLIGVFQVDDRPTPDQIRSFNQLCIIMTGEELPQEIHDRARWRAGHAATIEPRLDQGPFEFEVNEGDLEYCEEVLCNFCELKPDPESRWEHELRAEAGPIIGRPQLCCSIHDAGTPASASAPGGAERTVPIEAGPGGAAVGIEPLGVAGALKVLARIGRRVSDDEQTVEDIERELGEMSTWDARRSELAIHLDSALYHGYEGAVALMLAKVLRVVTDGSGMGAHAGAQLCWAPERCVAAAAPLPIVGGCVGEGSNYRDGVHGQTSESVWEPASGV